MATPTHSTDTPDDQEAELFHEGLRLFNSGEWFEAHEVWEDIWHMAGGDRKRFYQGLIQFAVTLVHLQRGNPRGVRSVSRSARGKFDGLPKIYQGIDTVKLLADLEALVRPVLDMPAETFEPGRGRGQVLPFDPDRAPKITLAYDPFAPPPADR